MATYARKPQPIDAKKSTRWGLASLGSVGVGYKEFGAGVQLFDLVNLSTGRAHRLQLANAGVGANYRQIPISLSIGKSDYAEFATARAVNFHDFDGTFMTVRETNIALYAWTTVSFWGMSVRIADGGANIPGVAVGAGLAKILFSDGRPVGTPELDPPEANFDPARERVGITSDGASKESDPALRIPGDLLFAFDQYKLKPGVRTEEALRKVQSVMVADLRPQHMFLIRGHTDSIGRAQYNKGLSERRAKTVAGWIIGKMPEWYGIIKTEGVGETDPVASNATAEGRARNRRVEVLLMPLRYWKDY